MSMRYYAFDDYGLVFNINHMNLLASAICNDFSQEKWDNDRDYVYDCIDEVRSLFEIEYVPEFSGECFPLNDDGTNNYSNSDIITYLDGDELWYMPSNRYPVLFKAAYNCMSDLVSEFKKCFVEYLPLDFDYRTNIKHIIGTYYG